MEQIVSPKLSPRTIELLEILQEEAAEVIQAVSKIKRFGIYSYHPADPEKVTNLQHLEVEIGDFVGMVDLLMHSQELKDLGVSWDHVMTNSAKKKEKVKSFLRT